MPESEERAPTVVKIKQQQQQQQNIMNQSLLKYETPLLVSEAKKRNKLKSTSGKRAGTLPPVIESKHQVSQTEDILNAILPPKYVHSPSFWIQKEDQWLTIGLCTRVSLISQTVGR